MVQMVLALTNRHFDSFSDGTIAALNADDQTGTPAKMAEKN